MKKYILDTNIISNLQTNNENGLKILEKLNVEDELFVSIRGLKAQ